MGYAFTKNLEVIQLPAGRVRQPRFPHLAPKATSLKTIAPNPLLHIRLHAKRRSAPRPGSATHGYRRPEYETTTRRQRRRCSRVRWPRFPHLAPRPHPSKHGSETASPHPVHGSKKRSERRSAPRPGSATHGYRSPKYETTTWRQSRRCSRVRRPRFPHLALRPHPSRQWLRIRFFAAGPMPKKRSARRSAPRPGSATHGYKRSESETTTQVSSLPDEGTLAKLQAHPQGEC